jgi:1,4-dihydroxy-2-naphthoate octaprenyltransferase
MERDVTADINAFKIVLINTLLHEYSNMQYNIQLTLFYICKIILKFCSRHEKLIMFLLFKIYTPKPVYFSSSLDRQNLNSNYFILFLANTPSKK